MQCKNLLWSVLTICCACLALAGAVSAQDNKTTRVSGGDPHYTQRGFFDIHVCNWPDRSLFFMGLFSTYEFRQLDSVAINMPDSSLLGHVALDHYRIIRGKNKPNKRVYITQFNIPKNAQSGWYTAVARFSDGGTVTAHDYVVIEAMQQADKFVPAHDQKDVPRDQVLSWDEVPGAKFYQVYISDAWDGSQVFKSKLASASKLILPEGTLEAEGWYRWRVHARDVHENILLGDFNHGSLSREIDFYTSGF